MRAVADKAEFKDSLKRTILLLTFDFGFILMPFLHAQTTYINAVLSLVSILFFSVFTLYYSTCAFVTCLLTRSI